MTITDLYLVRHGLADDDGDLSPLGSEQADRAGRRLSAVTFDAIHHSALPRAAATAQIIAGHVPAPRHACDHMLDRTPYPSDRSGYPERWRSWLDGVPVGERDPDAIRLRAAVAQLGVVGDTDRRELLITHNFVIGWFVRHVMDAPDWRWMSLYQENCAVTVLRWSSGRPPAMISFNS
ncbi:histidine phosphatase family protein [Actinoplanes hulinensis]|uniref:Histidine phosphatase family protein n=1 Tax=Actinoplanes hulinensis TaxID=1144547 RepID=A0ABS7B4F1_9ACTN|nr:histidine phosphatase family protein [Actinoplanes hulinensis]MBW6435917.1 histidine phosphatase family protein [Actinoplanes hulinensis]